MVLPLNRIQSLTKAFGPDTIAPRADAAAEVLAAADTSLSRLTPEERARPFHGLESEVQSLWFTGSGTVTLNPSKFVDPSSPRTPDLLDAVSAGGRLYAKGGEVAASLPDRGIAVIGERLHQDGLAMDAAASAVARAIEQTRKDGATEAVVEWSNFQPHDVYSQSMGGLMSAVTRHGAVLERVLPVVDERLSALNEGAHAAALALERVEKRALSPDHAARDLVGELEGMVQSGLRSLGSVRASDVVERVGVMRKRQVDIAGLEKRLLEPEGWLTGIAQVARVAAENAREETPALRAKLSLLAEQMDADAAKIASHRGQLLVRSLTPMDYGSAKYVGRDGGSAWGVTGDQRNTWGFEPERALSQLSERLRGAFADVKAELVLLENPALGSGVASADERIARVDARLAGLPAPSDT